MEKYQLYQILALVAFGGTVSVNGFNGQRLPKIVGGKEVEPHSMPWQAWGHGMGLCGATILCSSYVLTAGHCAGLDTIEVGLHNKDDNSEFNTTRTIHRVKRTILHPNFINHGDYPSHDIAVLELEEPIDIRHNRPEAKAIFLPNAEDTSFDNATVLVVSGWGTT